MSWYIDKGPENDVVLSTRVRLARNHAKYAFPRFISGEVALNCYSEITNAFFSANQNMADDYIVLPLRETNPILMRELVEKRLLSEDILNKVDTATAIINKNEETSILLGEEDHIRIQSMKAGLQLLEAYREAEKISLILEEKLPLAYNKDLGFLTACPTNVGTGMRVSVLLHLPAIGASKIFPQYVEMLRKAGYAVRGQYGEHSEATGYLYQISNQMTLGISEKFTIEDLERIVKEIADKERALRKQLFLEQRLRLEDQLYRSLGILKEARMLTTKEAKVLLSNMRLAVSLGLFNDVTYEDLNMLDSEMGAYALQKEVGRTLLPEERDYCRAILFRKTLNGKGRINDEYTSTKYNN